MNSQTVLQPEVYPPAENRDIERLRVLSRFMDSQFEIPGLGVRFGLDSIIGLVPGIGDAAGLAVSGFIMYEAARMGASRPLLLKMASNAAFDAIFGLVPIVGDLFDIAFRANKRNVELLLEAGEKGLLDERRDPSGAGEALRATAFWLMAIGLAIFVIPIAIILWMLA